MKPKRLAEQAPSAHLRHPGPVPPSAEQSPTPTVAQPLLTNATTRCGVDKNHVNTNTGERSGASEQPGAGFETPCEEY